MEISDKLIQDHRLNRNEFNELLEQWENPDLTTKLREEALRLRREVYGNDIYVRGLIEFTNICQKDCYYCGIRKSNPEPERYRMKKKEILECCDYGYKIGLRTFVLQGGEDGYFNDERLTDIVQSIKEKYPDCAITLSLGERSFDSYQALREAGADRYLLRHETADADHYRRLHPSDMSLQSRMNCLYDLKSLGYQVGAGFMVGSPYQTLECIAKDLVFLQDLQPEMVGIGPFMPQRDTSFSDHPAGSEDLTLFLISVIRILLPDVLLPATSALASLDPQQGRVKAMQAGANVLMPNISPPEYRGSYCLYDNKICVTEDTQEYLEKLKTTMEAAGFHIVYDRGDHRTDPSRPVPEEKPIDKAEEAEKRKEEIDKKKKKKKKKKEKKKEKDKAKKNAKAQEKEELKKKDKEKKDKEKKDKKKQKKNQEEKRNQ